MAEDLCIEWYINKNAQIGGKAVNPKSGRFIKLTGAVAKRLDKECEICDSFRINPFINPNTHKLLRPGSKEYMEIATKCKIKRAAFFKLHWDCMIRRLGRCNRQLLQLLNNQLPCIYTRWQENFWRNVEKL